MTLDTGSHLGQYEILSPLGAGGMGEVYRARDTKLGRDVAIKVLPEELSRDKERSARFEREARLLAQLNHPNIATLHGLEESESPQPERSAKRSGVAEREAVGVGPRGPGGSRQFLVMELVEGETLAERIGNGRIPLDEARPLFVQIAEGLEAAHEKGVIHRDLKPANIKITPEGKIKIWDFGLAKAFLPEADVSAETSQSPTLTKGTALGAIMGTAAYMSPEQARGKAVDRRTDIWAFGCCLYEALTGRPAFDGESVTDILAAVVRAEPDWHKLPPVPDGVSKLLRRCLSKGPSLRLRDIGDARLEILDATRESPPEDSTAPTGAWSWRPLLVGIVAAAALASFLTSALLHDAPDGAPSVVSRFELTLPSGERMPRAQRGALAIAPDGSRLVYVTRARGTSRLFLREMEDLEVRELEGTERARGPFFSPDGEWIGFIAGQQLKKVSVRGGAPLLLSDAESFWGASWSEDHQIVFSDGSSLFSVPASGGAPELVVSPEEGEPGIRFPYVLPGGKAILYSASSSGREDSEIAVLSLESGERQSLVPMGTDPHYVPTGHIVYGISGGRLMAAPFDLDALAVNGATSPIVEGTNVAVDGTAEFDISRQGTLAYRAGGSQRAEKLVWVDRRGRVEPVSDVAGFDNHPRISPDGRRVAGTRNTNTFILDLARDSWTQLTFDSGNRALWAPDGRTLFFASTRAGGQWDLFSAAADGSGDATQLTKDTYRVPASLSSEGSVIVFREWGAGWDIGMLRLDGKSEPELLLAESYDEHTGALSPDDRWLAYVSNESGQEEVFVTTFPRPGPKLQVSTDGGSEPCWSRDGNELFYRHEQQMLAVPISGDAEPDAGSPEILFEGPFQPSSASPYTNYDVASDGRFLMMEGPPTTEKIQVVLNWFRELERLVPVE